MMNRILGIVILALTAALTWAQERQSVPGALEWSPGELTAAQAVDKAAAFLKIVGEPALERRKVHYWIQKDPLEDDRRVYEVNEGLRSMEIDSRTGIVKYYSLSSYAFRDQIARLRLPSASWPTRARAEAIALATATAVGLPPGAKRFSFTISDRNPQRDADMRGFFSARYDGPDRSSLVLVFDRATGRLENLNRMPPPSGWVDPLRRKGG